MFRQICLAVLFFVSAASARAQASNAPRGKAARSEEARSTPMQEARRPRIGLALAGGSAHGLAHIGVLKWLEEHHIPVDRVAGASMGGLVGGMYASGMTAEEMHLFVAQANWEKIFETTPPYGDASFRRKEDLLAFPNDLLFGLRGGLRAPAGLNPGQEVSLTLSSFAAPYSELESFDDLPTPFRCVATDLVGGREVILDKGSLAEALRATMSLPGIFAPVKTDRVVLVDGGLLNNLPVDIVKDMGTDVVIAVALDTPGPNAAAIQSFLDVLSRSLDVVISENERANKQAANILLSPDLAGVSSTDYLRAEDLEKLGYEAAEKHADKLRKLAVSDEEWARYLEDRQSRRRFPTPHFVEVLGGGTHTKAIERELRSMIGKPLDQKKLDEALDRLVGTGQYETARYAIVTRDAEPGLRVVLTEKSYGPPFLNLGLTITGPKITDMRFEVDARVTFSDVGLSNSEWRNDFSLGYRNRFVSEYYRRIGDTPLFVAPRLFFDATREGLYVADHETAEDEFQQAGGGLDFGLALDPSDELRLGYEYRHLYVSPTIGTSPLPHISGHFNNVRLRWTHDSTDSATIPRAGVRISASFGYNFDAPGIAHGFPVMGGHFLIARQLTTNNLLIADAGGGSTFHQTTPYSTFTLGGPFQLSALAPYQLRGDHYYVQNLGFLRAVSQQPIALVNRSYLAFGYDLGSAFTDVAKQKPFVDGVIGWVGVTHVGAFFLGASVGEYGEKAIFLRVGRFYEPRD